MDPESRFWIHLPGEILERALFSFSRLGLVSRQALGVLFLSSLSPTKDTIDHPHIKGATVKGVEPLYEAMRKGTDKDWEERSGCMTFPDAVAKALKAKGQDPAKWLQDSRKMSIDQMRKAAADMGCDVFFDWDSARSVEGYFRIKGSTEFCIERAIAFAPYADCIWMETGKPILAQATQFAKEVRAAVPHQMLAYNLSPSFNWDSAGMTDAQMESFIWDLAKLGFCWQFITLAGFHCDVLSIDLQGVLQARCGGIRADDPAKGAREQGGDLDPPEVEWIGDRGRDGQHRERRPVLHRHHVRGRYREAILSMILQTPARAWSRTTVFATLDRFSRGCDTGDGGTWVPNV